MKILYRKHDYYSPIDNRALFGIQAKCEATNNAWMRCANDENEMLFKEEKQRDEFLKGLRAKERKKK